MSVYGVSIFKELAVVSPHAGQVFTLAYGQKPYENPPNLSTQVYVKNTVFCHMVDLGGPAVDTIYVEEAVSVLQFSSSLISFESIK